MKYGNDNHTYELVDGWADLPDDESFHDVGSVCVDGNDDVLVLNRSRRPVMTFDETGDRLSAWGEGYFSERPHGMCLGPDGDVYCTDDGNHTVRKFSRDGDLLLTLGTEGHPSETGFRDVRDIFEGLASITGSAGPFNRPTGVTVADSGEIYVADGYGNARIHRFGPEGDLRQSWGEPGADTGEFRVPHAITRDDNGRVWVVDRENSRIQIFEPDGEFIAEWNDLIRPTDLATYGETVYVSELCKRVSVFTSDGEPLARWGNDRRPPDAPLFVAPHTIAVDSNGDLYVGEASFTYEGVDRGARTVQKFERVD